MVSRAKSWMLVGVILLIGWVLSSVPAQAGKMPKALLFDGTGTGIEVVSIYETSYAAQKTTVKSLKLPTKLMKKAMGFQGSSMLQSQDGTQVIALSQWQDLTQYQAYQPAPPPAGSSLSSPPAPTHTLLFQVVNAQTSIPGATPALRGKEAVVQWVQLTPQDAEARSPLLAQLETWMAQRLTQQPIPQSILLLQGVDQEAIALMLNWNCSALFADVGAPEAIAFPPELTALANATQQFYNVVNIVPAALKKPETEED